MASVCSTNLHVTSVTELDNSFPMEKSVLVSAPCVAVVFLKLDVRDQFVAWSPVQSVTLVDSHLRKRWTVKENWWTEFRGLKMIGFNPNREHLIGNTF